MPVDAEMRGRREVGCSDTGSLGVSGTEMETETEAGVGSERGGWNVIMLVKYDWVFITILKGVGMIPR